MRCTNITCVNINFVLTSVVEVCVCLNKQLKCISCSAFTPMPCLQSFQGFLHNVVQNLVCLSLALMFKFGKKVSHCNETWHVFCHKAVNIHIRNVKFHNQCNKMPD